MEAPLPLDEAGRLRALRRYHILDTVAEEVFDDLTYLAASICNMPMATLTFVDENRQWFKSVVGLDVQETPRCTSFCAHTILQDEVMVIPDATQDERFAEYASVTGEPHFRFYAGVPLVSAEGYALGSLCVLDTKPRQLNDSQLEALKRLGRQVMSCLEARLIVHRQQEGGDNFVSRDSDLAYRSLFDSARDGLFILDTVSRRVVDVNPALEKLLGLSRWQCLDRTLEDLGFRRSGRVGVPGLAADSSNHLNAQKLSLRTSGGQLREVELLWSAYGPEGSGAVQGNVRDITARTEAEASLRESEERFRLLLESVEDYAIYMLTPDGRVASWNAGAQRLKGYSASEVIGQSMSRFYLPEDVAAGKPQLDIEMAMQVGRYEEEGWRVRKNGERFWAQMLLAEVRDESGALRGFSKVTRDITERKRAQEALDQSNRDMRAIWESMTDSFVAVNREWIITHANEHAFNLLQKKRDELIGHNMWEVFPNAMGLSFPRQYQKAFDTQKPVIFEECYEPLDYWYEIHAHPSPNGLSIYFRDITQRKRSEQAVRQSEARFHDMIANAPGMFYQFLLRTDGVVEIPFVNDGSRRVLEMAPEDVRSNATNIAQIICPEDRVEWQISIVQSAATLTHWEWEGRVQLPNGKTKWVSGSARPRRLENGATLWFGVLTDISERKRAEEDRDRFFTLSLDMLCIVNGRGYFHRLNPAFQETLGFSSTELMARSLLDFVHPDDVDKTKVALQSLFVDEIPQQFVNRFLCSDGSYKWLSWRSTPYGGLNYAAARDITALKQAAEELNRSNLELETRVARRTAELAQTNEELHLEMRERQRTVEAHLESLSLLNAVIEGSDDSIFVKDLDGRYLMINSAGAEQRNSTKSEVINKKDEDFFSPEATAAIRETDRRTLASGMTQTYEQTIEDKGIQRTSLITKGVHRNPAGEAIGIVGMARDITALRQQSDALKKAKEEADKANQAKSEFLSRMSHELRTPLNAILGFGQILEMSAMGAEGRAAVTQILKGGWHLLDLVNEVLEISRVEAGHIELALEPVSLADLVTESCALVRPLADHRHIRLEENCEHLCPVYVMADRQRIKQVLINLLSNAIKYNFSGGRVDVSCSQRENGNIRISVKDTGPGISEANRSKLFRPFERLDAAQSKVEGSGLGLALSQGLIQAMSGILGLDSPEEGGSIFWCELPATEPPLQTVDMTQQSATEIEPLVGPGRTYTVLSIEDNLSNLWLLEAIIARRPEINLLAAMQGSIGIDMASQHQPDLILLDLDLPDIHGAEVMARLHADSKTANIPIIVISADATAGQIERLLRAGAKDYLTKPLDVSKFLRTMDDVLLLSQPEEVEPKSEPVVERATQALENDSALRILVVEDNPVNQQVALHQLKNLGHDVTIVDQGQAALGIWREGEFSLILLDCNLPDMDGYDVAREIRLQETEGSHIPIIALTATATESDRERCLEAGMDDYLSKPTKQSELGAALARWTSGGEHAKKSESVLGQERWNELETELDAELIGDLVGLFLEEVPPILVELRGAAEEMNVSALRSAAHKLKGSCATMGVARMAALCLQLEERTASGTLENVPDLIEQLSDEFPLARTALEKKIAD